MKLCRIKHKALNSPSYASIENDVVYPVEEGDWFDSRSSPRSATAFPLNEVELLAPVTPSKIVCVGRNYVEHAAELGNKMPDEPLLFLKAPSAIMASGRSIALPGDSKQVEHEGELGVVMGRRASKLTSSEYPLTYV